MKRFFAIAFSVLTVCALLAALAWCGYCLWDHRQLLQTAGISGIDFLMNGVIYGIGLTAISAAGAVCALMQNRLTESRKLQNFGYIATGLFLIGMIVAFILLFV